MVQKIQGYWLFRERFVLVVVALLLLIISAPFSGALPENIMVVVGNTLFFLVLIACIFAVSEDERSFKQGIILGIASIISIPLIYIIPTGSTVWIVVSLFLNMVVLCFIIFTVVTIIANVARAGHITINVLFGAVAGYLLMGFIGATICLNVELNDEGSFDLPEGTETGESLPEDFSTFMYFSFVTILSLGYGDITPVSESARTCAIMLGLFGQLYPAILMAILVGKYITHSGKEDNGNDDEEERPVMEGEESASGKESVERENDRVIPDVKENGAVVTKRDNG